MLAAADRLTHPEERNLFFQQVAQIFLGNACYANPAPPPKLNKVFET